MTLKKKQISPQLVQDRTKYIAQRLQLIRQKLNLTTNEIIEEMIAMGFYMTYPTLHNYEKEMKKGISLDYLQYLVIKGINLKYLLKPNNTDEPIFDMHIKETNQFLTDKKFVIDLLNTAIETIQKK